MRVKVEDTWYKVTSDCPLVVELTPRDKLNIRKMDKSNTKYACFSDDDPRSLEQKLEWME